MPRLPVPSVVLFVVDVPRVSAFYRELASMTLLHQDDSHVGLATHGLELVVHQLRGKPPVTTDTLGRPALREDSYWKLALPVASIAAARTTAAMLGGGLKSPEQEWEARGFRACDGYDPEGNVIQVREAVE